MFSPSFTGTTIIVCFCFSVILFCFVSASTISGCKVTAIRAKHQTFGRFFISRPRISVCARLFSRLYIKENARCAHACARLASSGSRRRIDEASSTHRWSLVDALTMARRCIVDFGSTRGHKKRKGVTTLFLSVLFPFLCPDYRLGLSLPHSSTAGMMPRPMISSRIFWRCS